MWLYDVRDIFSFLEFVIYGALVFVLNKYLLYSYFYDHFFFSLGPLIKTLYKLQLHKTCMCIPGRGKDKERGEKGRGKWNRQRQLERKEKSSTGKSQSWWDQPVWMCLDLWIGFLLPKRQMTFNFFLSFLYMWFSQEGKAGDPGCEFILPVWILLKTWNNIHFIWPKGLIVHYILLQAFSLVDFLRVNNLTCSIN